MKINLTTILKFLVGWPLSIAALYFIYTTFSDDLGNIQENIQSLNYTLLGTGIIVFLAYYFLRSVIWHKILEYLGYQLSYKETSFLWGSAQLKRYIPGNIWGYVGLTVLFADKKVTKRDIAHSIVVETQIVIIATCFLALLSLPFIMENFFPDLPLSEFLKNSIFYILVVATLLYLYSGKIVKRLNKKFTNYLLHILPGFQLEQTLTLLLLMVLSYVFFGFGYYFTISSFLPLPLDMLPTLLGLFIFSLLIGFLSFLTPTGLGVREGAITIGLSKIVPVNLAGFAAIFARVFLIISEIIYVALSYIWYKSKSKTLAKIEDFTMKNAHMVMLTFFVTLHATYFTIISFLRYDNFYTGRFDLGNMTQTVWNTAHGRIFQFTNPDGEEIVSRLAFHADFILLFFAPFYWIWESPKVLLFFQAITVSLGAYFVFLIARHMLKNKTIALAIALSYLLNPSLNWATIFDFHAVVLATTLLLGAIYFLLKKRYWWFLIFAALAALTKEQVWFVIAFFGPILFFFHKKRLFGSILFVFCLGMFYFLLWHAIPNAASSQGHFALTYFDDGGSSPSDLARSSITHPDATIKKLLAEERVDYIKALLMPLGYLPLYFPFWLIFSSADFALNLLSDKEELHQIYYQYTATITPFLYVSAIFALFYIKKYLKLNTVIAAYIIIFAVYGAYRYGPLPGSKDPNISMITIPLPHREEINAKLAEIPLENSVAATNEPGTQLSHRERIYSAGGDVRHADYVVLFHRLSDKDIDGYTYELIDFLKKEPEFELWYQKYGLTIFKKSGI